jgi:hypothetical protein
MKTILQWAVKIEIEAKDEIVKWHLKIIAFYPRLLTKQNEAWANPTNLIRQG